MTSLALLLAQSEIPGWIGGLAERGILGLVVLALVFGKIVPGYIADQKDKKIEKLEAKNEAYETLMREQVLPALMKSNEVISRALAEIGTKQ